MRTTLSINDKLYRALKRRALESDATISALVEEAVANQLLEDFEDLEDAASRHGEPTYSFNELVSELKSEGLL